MIMPEEYQDDSEELEDEESEELESEDIPSQFAIDRISDTEWQICDFESGEQPATYLLVVSEIEGNKFANKNFALVECDCDNFDNAFEEYQSFTREVWSSQVYIADAKRYEEFCEKIVEIMPRVTISNPIELAYMFGGMVHSKKVNMPVLKHTN